MIVPEVDGEDNVSLDAIAARITACRLCPRLVRHRETVAARPPRRYQGQTYWARPLPGFGDPRARVLVMGLAPAAHGGNRTGRMFTGDRSGDWLFRALHAAGFASQPTSAHRDDGLTLTDAYITAAARCAPPANKPTPAEQARCQPYLLGEMRSLTRLRVVVALGKIGHDAYLAHVAETHGVRPRPRPAFAHGSEARLGPDLPILLGSYHPSRQNTNTGKLTPPMMRSVFLRARDLIG